MEEKLDVNWILQHIYEVMIGLTLIYSIYLVHILVHNVFFLICYIILAFVAFFSLILFPLTLIQRDFRFRSNQIGFYYLMIVTIITMYIIFFILKVIR